MNSEDFVRAIKQVVLESAVNGTETLLRKPPGRAPAREWVELSAWYNAISENDKAMLRRVLMANAHGVVFNFLAVLDGVSVVDATEDARFELLHGVGDSMTNLTDPHGEFLHDILNSLMDE